MKKWLKVLLGFIFTITVLIVAGSLVAYFTLLSKLPDYEGLKTVNGISSEVEIYRDSFAVPYIIAKTEFDAAFSMGYVHAQERLFQMDITRRAGEGRLSEILGGEAIPFDKMFRTIGVYKSVLDNYDKLNLLTKKYLEAYANGVNAFITDADGNFTFEFDILGYDPYPWKPEHSLVIAKLMAWELNISWWTDVAFSHLVQKLGAEKVKEILPDYDENAPTIIPDELENLTAVTSDFYKVDKKFREFMGFVGTHIGSNSWVVNAEKSASGKVLVANDPHLAFQAPGKFLFAVVRSDEWNAEGFSIPGLPVFIIGKNQNISWGLTNVMTDDADFYVEKLDSPRTKYLLNNNWNDLEIRKDTIIVKDSSNVEIEIRSTHRGPIISDIHTYNVLFKNDYQNRADMSMRWTALDLTDEIFAAISINKAANWKEFKTGLEYFIAPGQNFIYGDKEGNIGYVCATKLPMRESYSPTLIYDGTTDRYDWKGFVPYDKMPKLFNPSQNYIASANNKTIKNFPYHISNIWEPSSRIDRIKELLNSKENHSLEDFKKYQLDFYSYYAKDITNYILGAFKNVSIKDDNLKMALELLAKWDFMMDKRSQTPAIYLVFYQNLMKNIFLDEMGEELFKEYIFIANVPYRKIQEMLKENNSEWWNDINTSEVENRDYIIRKSLTDALTELENKFGSDIANWQWMNLHSVTFKHPFSNAGPILGHVLDIGPFPIGGDGTTIFNTEYSFTEPFENKLGPAMRFLFDFSKPDELYFIMATGQSGYFLSDHYDDMTQYWLEGNYIKLNINTSDIHERGYSLLSLKNDE